MASIFRHGERWRAAVFRHGHRESKVFGTKREAQAWALTKEAELNAGKVGKGRTFADAVALYLKTVSVEKSGPAWESRRFAAFAGYFGSKTILATIDSEKVGQWRDFRLTGDALHKPVSGSTVQRESNLLRNLFTIATDEWRWIERNPFKGVRLPKENAPRQTVWTWQLIKRVLRANRIGKTEEMIRAFHISLHTALRLQEVLNSTFDPKRRVMALGKSKGVQAGVRVEIPVTRRAVKVLGHQFIVGPNEGSTLFSKLCRELLIKDLTFHDARGTALTLMARRMDVMTLAKISRHKNLNLLLSTYYRETAEQISKRI